MKCCISVICGQQLVVDLKEEAGKHIFKHYPTLLLLGLQKTAYYIWLRGNDMHPLTPELDIKGCKSCAYNQVMRQLKQTP